VLGDREELSRAQRPVTIWRAVARDQPDLAHERHRRVAGRLSRRRIAAEREEKRDDQVWLEVCVSLALPNRGRRVAGERIGGLGGDVEVDRGLGR
jgi:hypothetical protein